MREREGGRLPVHRRGIGVVVVVLGWRGGGCAAWVLKFRVANVVVEDGEGPGLAAAEEWVVRG